MKRLLVVIFAALLLVSLNAMPAQAAKRDTPDIPIPVTFKTCEITQHTNAIVAIDPLANDYLVGGFGEIRSNNDFDMNSCQVCLPYTKKVCDTCPKYLMTTVCDNFDPHSGERECINVIWYGTYDCNCRDVRLCNYVPCGD